MVGLVRLARMLGLKELKELQLQTTSAISSTFQFLLPCSVLNPAQAPFSAQRPGHSPVLVPAPASDPAHAPDPVPDMAPDPAIRLQIRS